MILLRQRSKEQPTGWLAPFVPEGNNRPNRSGRIEDRKTDPGEWFEGLRSFKMERMVHGAPVQPEVDNGEDSEGTVRFGHLKAIDSLASIGER